MRRSKIALLSMTTAIAYSILLAPAAAAPMGKVHNLAGANAPPASSITPMTQGISCAASAWIPDNRTINHPTDIPNPSGTNDLKSLVIYFSPGGGHASIYPVQWSFEPSHSGNPVTIEITPNYITLHIWSGAALHGVWNARSSPQHWTRYDSGFWKVVTCK